MAERGAMGCEGPKDAAAFVELLRNREVVSYVQRAMVTYDNDGPLPPALLDEELAQALVLFARRVAGRPALVPIDGQAGEPESLDYWYVSPETGVCLRVLEEKARVLGNTHAIGRLLELDEVRARVADDLGAAAARDGIATDRESLRRVIVGDRAPCDGTEQFVQGGVWGVLQVAGCGIPPYGSLALLHPRVFESAGRRIRCGRATDGKPLARRKLLQDAACAFRARVDVSFYRHARGEGERSSLLCAYGV